MNLIDTTDIIDLLEREYKLMIWLRDNLWHKDYDINARERAALTVKISHYYKNNKV